MMRGNKKQTEGKADQVPAYSPGQSMHAVQEGLKCGFQICLNRNVVAGLAVVGLDIWFLVPNLVWAAVPVLGVLACPLSMLLMMGGMGSDQCAPQVEQKQRPREEQLAQLRAQHAAITREIAELESASDATPITQRST